MSLLFSYWLKRPRFGLLTVFLITLSGCAMQAQQDVLAGTYLGPPVAIGQGQAATFVTLDARGQAQTLGIRMSEAALSGLPAEGDPPHGAKEYTLHLPTEAKGTGYDHVTLDWNPRGHIPEGVYDVPHFDFHFYMVDEHLREGITATGEDLAIAHTVPPANEMPADYVLPPGTEVAKMGAHAIDPSSDEFNQKPFTYTFIYGYYDGRMIFMEPMVSLEYLRSRPEMFVKVKQPEVYVQKVHYPTRFGVRYYAGEQHYEITLEGLVPR
ncbi:DUF5602 domain-containing protein [Marinobacterium maritimum]|uniref:DUF5602 domain-containing protein n=1 Tax=Marinobacterium maritimum TaxID=500162 RepID=A0ABP3TF47_9GAMM